MRESYFTPGTMDQAARTMIDDLFPKGQKRAKSLVLENSALLALDLQEYFLNQDSHAYVPSAPAIVPVINSLAACFADAGRPVIFSQHLDEPDKAGNMAAWWRDLITSDHPLKSISPNLKLASGEIFKKSQYDAFYGSDLEARLATQGVSQLVIGGVMTHLCCETTARAAFVRGFEVFFLVDGTATYNREFHMASLRNLGHGFATLVTSHQVLQDFGWRA